MFLDLVLMNIINMTKMHGLKDKEDIQLAKVQEISSEKFKFQGPEPMKRNFLNQRAK